MRAVELREVDQLHLESDPKLAQTPPPRVEAGRHPRGVVEGGAHRHADALLPWLTRRRGSALAAARRTGAGALLLAVQLEEELGSLDEPACRGASLLGNPEARRTRGFPSRTP